jgi:Sensors of blue-light using FAD
MSLEAVGYTSSAVPDITDATLELLLTDARQKNDELGVTGVLLFHDGSFFQYFEGPPPAVNQVYDRIRQSRLHTGIIELMRSPIEHRAFANWLMGFTRAPASTVLQISNANWRASLGPGGAAGAESDGLALLRRFWSLSGGAVSK